MNERFSPSGRIQGRSRPRRSEALLKTLVLSDYRRYLGKHWRALDLHMENHQTGKRTRLVYSDYRFRTGLSDRDFTRNVLKRTR